jgi:hypothetical protein
LPAHLFQGHVQVSNVDLTATLRTDTQNLCDHEKDSPEALEKNFAFSLLSLAYSFVFGEDRYQRGKNNSCAAAILNRAGGVRVFSGVEARYSLMDGMDKVDTMDRMDGKHSKLDGVGARLAVYPEISTTVLSGICML